GPSTGAAGLSGLALRRPHAALRRGRPPGVRRPPRGLLFLPLTTSTGRGEVQGVNSMNGSEVVVITGASAGVGRATARAFARRGASVGLLARGRDGLEAAREE